MEDSVGERFKNIACKFVPLGTKMYFEHIKISDFSGIFGTSSVDVSAGETKIFIIETGIYPIGKSKWKRIPLKFEVIMLEDGSVDFIEYREIYDSSIHKNINLITSDLKNCVAYIVRSGFEVLEKKFVAISLSHSYILRDPLLYYYVKNIDPKRATKVRNEAMELLLSNSDAHERSKKYRHVDEETFSWVCRTVRVAIDEFKFFYKNRVFRGRVVEEVEEEEDEEEEEGEEEEEEIKEEIKEEEQKEGKIKEEEEEEEIIEKEEEEIKKKVKRKKTAKEIRKMFFNLPESEYIFEVAAVTNKQGWFCRNLNFRDLFKRLFSGYDKKTQAVFVGTEEQSKVDPNTIKKPISTRVSLFPQKVRFFSVFLPKAAHYEYKQELNERLKSPSGIENRMTKLILSKKIIGVKQEIKSSEKRLKKVITKEIKASEKRMKKVITKEIKSVKEEFTKEIKSVKEEITSVKEEYTKEIKSVKEEITSVKEEIKSVKEEITKEIKSVIKSVIKEELKNFFDEKSPKKLEEADSVVVGKK